jgi:iron complex transport system ATP-binding protein
MTVIAVTHDLNLAASYADRIVVLSEGCIAADGQPAEVLQVAILREVFDVDLEIRQGPAGKPWVFYERAAPESRTRDNEPHSGPLC